MPRIKLLIIILCYSMVLPSIAAAEDSLLRAAFSTPVNIEQEPAPIIEASVDEPVLLIPNASNLDEPAAAGENYKGFNASNSAATINFVHLTNITFAGEQVELSAEQTAAIDKVIAHLTRNQGEPHSVLVTAHADDTGDDAHNLQLSHARASSVADYLKKRGVIERVIRTHSFGRAQPRDESWTENGRQFNRRVSITLIQSNSTEPSI